MVQEAVQLHKYACAAIKKLLSVPGPERERKGERRRWTEVPSTAATWATVADVAAAAAAAVVILITLAKSQIW